MSRTNPTGHPAAGRGDAAQHRVPPGIRAVIADLDGVLTRTARLHALAWKRMLDEVLARRRERGEEHEDFTQEDYERLVDGKPRDEGLESFLRSRGISIAQGSPDDEPGAETVRGLGKRKNELFHQLLESQGIELYRRSIDAIRRFEEAGLLTAVVSSSRNCAAVLAAAGLEDFFDARVDGRTAAEEGLAGKPAPDLFLRAARELGVDAGRCIVVEDSTAGVEAGRRGGFGLVVGIDHGGRRAELERAGAEVVVEHLGQLELAPERRDGEAPPSALEHFTAIEERLANRKLVVFLDYDGTLTPIVSRPRDAVLSDDMRRVLSRLAARVPLAVVSGRDRADVEKLVGLAELYYAGSHGFDISGPHGMRAEHAGGVEALPALDRAETELRRLPASIPGTELERKRFALAIHYRNTPEERSSEVQDAVDRVHARLEGLRQGRGKMVLELQPDVDWDKGRAILWLLERLGLDRPDVLALYVGDDLTDEDAFRALGERGVGIFVGALERATAAGYVVDDTDEVRELLERLADLLEERR
jgi:alpha,alpha-trehalase